MGLWRGLIPPSWLMASEATVQFSVSVCHFTVDALSLSMPCLMSLHLPRLLFYQSPQC